jgi:hypothetical protein
MQEICHCGEMGGKGFPHRKVFRRQNKRYLTVSAWLELAQVMLRRM